MLFILEIVDRRNVKTILDEMTPGIETVFVKAKQNFAPGEPFFDMFDEQTMCHNCTRDRWLNRWNIFHTHENSGPCYSYNPPRISMAGSQHYLHLILSKFNGL